MASQPLVALGVDNTQPNSLGAFSAGQEAAAGADKAKMAHAEQIATLLGSGALYAMNGDINGEVDPAKYNEVLDAFKQEGIDVEKYRSNPNFAKVFANASVGYLDRMKLAQNEQEHELALKKFDEDIRQFDISSAQKDKQLAQIGSKQYGTPVYARDKDGNIVLLQPTSSGDLARPAVPDDLSIIPPDEMAGAKSFQTTVNKAAGGAEATIPMAEQMVGEINSQIDAIETDPDLNSQIGPVAGRMPNLTARSNRIQSMLDQLSGDAFLQTRAMLRGGGQITDYEGQQAEKALLRMKASLTDPETFKAALNDFRNHVNKGLEVLKQQASLGGNLTKRGGGGTEGTPGGGDADPLGIR